MNEAFEIRPGLLYSVPKPARDPLYLRFIIQPWIADAAPDTDGRGDDVLGWNDHVVFVLHPGQWVPAVKPEEVWQTTSLSETGFQCARRGY